MRLSRGVIIFITILITSSVFLIACSDDNTEKGNNATQNKDEFKWDLMSHVGLDENTGIFISGFADSVRERTDGRLDITVRPPGELPYSSEDSVSVTSNRQVEMSNVVMGYVAGDVEAAIIPTWPFIAGEMDKFGKAVEAVLPYATDELEKFGIESLFWLIDPPQNIWGKGEPITKLEDLKGRKVRTYTPEQQELMRELGATPVSLVLSEVPAALQRGLVDAAITSSVGAYESKWYDIIDWGYTIPLSGSGAFNLINQEALNELPEDIREVLLEEAERWQEEGVSQMEEWGLEAIENLKDEGIEIYEASSDDITKGMELSKQYWESWAEEQGITEPLEAILNAIE